MWRIVVTPVETDDDSMGAKIRIILQTYSLLSLKVTKRYENEREAAPTSSATIHRPALFLFAPLAYAAYFIIPCYSFEFVLNQRMEVKYPYYVMTLNGASRETFTVFNSPQTRAILCTDRLVVVTWQFTLLKPVV